MHLLVCILSVLLEKSICQKKKFMLYASLKSNVIKFDKSTSYIYKFQVHIDNNSVLTTRIFFGKIVFPYFMRVPINKTRYRSQLKYMFVEDESLDLRIKAYRYNMRMDHKD